MWQKSERFSIPGRTHLSLKKLCGTKFQRIPISFYHNKDHVFPAHLPSRVLSLVSRELTNKSVSTVSRKLEHRLLTDVIEGAFHQSSHNHLSSAKKYTCSGTIHNTLMTKMSRFIPILWIRTNMYSHVFSVLLIPRLIKLGRQYFLCKCNFINDEANYWVCFHPIPRFCHCDSSECLLSDGLLQMSRYLCSHQWFWELFFTLENSFFKQTLIISNYNIKKTGIFD